MRRQATPAASDASAPPPLPDRVALLRASRRLAELDGLPEQALRWHGAAIEGRRALAYEAERIARPRIWPDTLGALAATGWRVARTAAPDAPVVLVGAAATAFGLPVGPPDASAGTIARAQRLVRAGGPAYVKLGQFIASARGLLPDAWVDAFAWCRDAAPPLEPGTAEAILRRELGERAHGIELDPEPLAAASIGQVHRGRLRDGTEVVVKVRRPGLRARFRSDIETLALVCAGADRINNAVRVANLPGFVAVFARLSLEELDFRLEAANLVESVAVLEDIGVDGVRVPRPLPGMVNERVIVMEHLPGVSYARLADQPGAVVDGPRLLELGVRAVLEATLRHGVFHGDLHAGNVLIAGEGFSLVDLGLCGRLDAAERAGLVRFLIGFAAADARMQVEAMRSFGALEHDADVDALVERFQAEVDRLADRSDGAVTFDRLGLTLGRLLQSLSAGGVRIPKELVLFFKNLLYLGDFAASVAPGADVLAVVEGLLQDLFSQPDGDGAGLLALVAG
ncbi:Ubiquinone biosynthesis monooxygenase UbiB [Patulibacter medicamentivorans]|uniref:Ubiquinone biosynthesis monooxygenase UbiB n=1 Tax=Patulibacter medicamentivorans TaxID=1097667 RepID=H0E4N9_9ACTN|nr:AarF/ABC1/UbiB kinase family protein [Patulibacter medicamentivorans]EHN11352.1 Ubiquinone biosynthesis monooxygenase UbiB [Patulibacter medicamentivorans]